MNKLIFSIFFFIIGSISVLAEQYAVFYSEYYPAKNTTPYACPLQNIGQNGGISGEDVSFSTPDVTISFTQVSTKVSKSDKTSETTIWRAQDILNISIAEGYTITRVEFALSDTTDPNKMKVNTGQIADTNYHYVSLVKWIGRGDDTLILSSSEDIMVTFFIVYYEKTDELTDESGNMEYSEFPCCLYLRLLDGKVDFSETTYQVHRIKGSTHLFEGEYDNIDSNFRFIISRHPVYNEGFNYGPTLEDSLFTLEDSKPWQLMLQQSDLLSITDCASSNYGTLKVEIDLSMPPRVILTKNPQKDEMSFPEKLWLPGLNGDWNFNESTYYLSPSSNIPYIYSGTFNIEESEIEFLLTDSSDWDHNVYGTNSDFSISVTEDNSYTYTMVLDGKPFKITPIEDYPVKITADLSEQSIKIEKVFDYSGIKGLPKSSDTKDKIFNIHGLEVDKNILTPGFYIINGKKILVK